MRARVYLPLLSPFDDNDSAILCERATVQRTHRLHIESDTKTDLYDLRRFISSHIHTYLSN